MGNWGYYFSEFHNCITLGPTLWEDGGLEEAAGHGILTGNLCAWGQNKFSVAYPRLLLEWRLNLCCSKLGLQDMSDMSSLACFCGSVGVRKRFWGVCWEGEGRVAFQNDLLSKIHTPSGFQADGKSLQSPVLCWFIATEKCYCFQSLKFFRVASPLPNRRSLLRWRSRWICPKLTFLP